jgi:hypothetical protein
MTARNLATVESLQLIARSSLPKGTPIAINVENAPLLATASAALAEPVCARSDAYDLFPKTPSLTKGFFCVVIFKRRALENYYTFPK